MRWASEGKERVHGCRGGGELGEDGAVSFSVRASELLGRFSRRVSTAVIVYAMLITETENNQL